MQMDIKSDKQLMNIVCAWNWSKLVNLYHVHVFWKVVVKMWYSVCAWLYGQALHILICCFLLVHCFFIGIVKRKIWKTILIYKPTV